MVLKNTTGTESPSPTIGMKILTATNASKILGRAVVFVHFCNPNLDSLGELSIRNLFLLTCLNPFFFFIFPNCQ